MWPHASFARAHVGHAALAAHIPAPIHAQDVCDTKAYQFNATLLSSSCLSTYEVSAGGCHALTWHRQPHAHQLPGPPLAPASQLPGRAAQSPEPGPHTTHAAAASKPCACVTCNDSCLPAGSHYLLTSPCPSAHAPASI